MSDTADLSRIAGELVLGLLPEAEEQAAFDRLKNDPAFARAAARWEMSLAGLSADLTPIGPPPSLKLALEDRIDREAAGSPGATQMRSRPDSPPPVHRLRAWQALAAGLAVVALVEGALLATRPAPEPVVERVVVTEERQPPYVAALVPTDATPPIVVSLDVPQGILSVDPSGLEAGDRAVELWLLPAGGGAPISLGLLTPNTDNTVEVPVALAGLDPTLLPSLAISLEPPGGSPSGAPTGPVVAAGAVRPLADRPAPLDQSPSER